MSFLEESSEYNLSTEELRLLGSLQEWDSSTGGGLFTSAWDPAFQKTLEKSVGKSKRQRKKSI